MEKEVTISKIEELKAKYQLKDIHTITVTEDNKEFKGYLKTPNRQTYNNALGYMMPFNGVPQYITAGEIIIRECWLEGDQEILNDETFLTTASMQAISLIELKKAEIKKN